MPPSAGLRLAPDQGLCHMTTPESPKGAGRAPEGAAKPESKSAYKDTVFLPNTPFPMRAGLNKSEPEWLARWKKIGLYQRQREASKGRRKFIFHDGPPYANANIHLGTAFNKTLKDFVARSRQMMGFDTPYVHGWDCHGLPIEWKIEEQYRAKGQNKDAVPLVEFRAECRAFAAHWMEVQKSEFIRIGCNGDWDHPYTTMHFAAEAQIVRELQKFLMNGLLYRGSKPVMWSPVEKTALAEAEVEYHDKNSPQIWVAFKVVKGPAAISDARIVIWTTTPWTIPGNRAISYSSRIAYGIYQRADNGEKLVLADTLAESVAKEIKTELRRIADAPDLAGVICAHPFRGFAGADGGYDFDVPLLDGDHVTDDAGTGFVHTAPGHGADDFDIWKRNFPDAEIPFTVAEDGSYYPHVPLFAGLLIMKPDGKDADANRAVMAKMTEVGALIASGRFVHSYPHSWRSKAPVIFRNTPQWFVALDKPFAAEGEIDYGPSLRERALAAIDATDFYPERGRNRLRAMVETRPDWVLSRQRAWGVPLTLFVEKATGNLLKDAAVNKRIADAVEARGADAWYTDDPQTFLGSAYKADDYEQVRDILDVWFDSGSTHAFVLEDQVDAAWTHTWPADLYLEGSDQHRGWFQASLLESCGTRGRAPYRAVVTHGFIVDGQGRKMSKSLGNVISPVDVANEQGADILRLWAASADYGMDPPLDKAILAKVGESYRKLRNTLRYLLGALDGFDEKAEHVADGDLPPLERYMRHRLTEVSHEVREGFSGYDFIRAYTALNTFMVNDLSAFYLDIRKDALYCDDPTSLRRRATRQFMNEAFRALAAWLAPILPFTAEEAWLTRYPGETNSVHLELWPEFPASWKNEALAANWQRMRDLRRVVTGALELRRAAKEIGSSLEAAPTLYLARAEDRALLNAALLAEIAITSSAFIAEGDGPADAFRLPDVADASVTFAMAKGMKCERCWKTLEDTGSDPAFPGTCRRCAHALHQRKAHGGA